jgi:hypothetical protein
VFSCRTKPACRAAPALILPKTRRCSFSRLCALCVSIGGAPLLTRLATHQHRAPRTRPLFDMGKSAAASRLLNHLNAERRCLAGLGCVVVAFRSNARSARAPAGQSSPLQFYRKPPREAGYPERGAKDSRFPNSGRHLSCLQSRLQPISDN